jgi:hypothetical protein
MKESQVNIRRFWTVLISFGKVDLKRKMQSGCQGEDLEHLILRIDAHLSLATNDSIQ